MISTWIPTVLATTSRHLRAKLGLDASRAEEIALVALEYALKPALTGTGSAPRNAADLQALTLFKAKNLAKDHYRRTRRSPFKASIDAFRTEDDEKAASESPWVQHASYENWRDRAHADARAAFAAELYGRLDELFDRISLSDFRRRVFKAAYLDQEPTTSVSKRFGIKPNYVYNIVFTTKAALARLAADLQAAA